MFHWLDSNLLSFAAIESNLGDARQEYTRVARDNNAQPQHWGCSFPDCMGSARDRKRVLLVIENVWTRMANLCLVDSPYRPLRLKGADPPRAA